MTTDCEKCKHSVTRIVVLRTTTERKGRCDKFDVPLPASGYCWCRWPSFYKKLQELYDDK